jgi:hypothetical protein
LVERLKEASSPKFQVHLDPAHDIFVGDFEEIFVVFEGKAGAALLAAALLHFLFIILFYKGIAFCVLTRQERF